MTLWGGRFTKPTDALTRAFSDSRAFDIRLFDEDITGSVAWVRTLRRAGVLDESEVEALIAGLEQVRHEIAADSFAIDPGDEDIHTAVERRLGEIAGAVAGKLHTGRSRNDQVATDLRLWTMRACDSLAAELAALQQTLLERAREGLDLAMPGYTHLQPAQPVTWAHWLLSHFWPLVRDRERFAHTRSGAAVLPLGSGALAGTAFSIDRQALAAELGFERPSENSIDAVSDRDFVADFLFAAAMLGVHLSRLAEQLVIFGSQEFGFVVFDDAFTTGSSLMPQKKNPDTLELTRGKAGRLIGHLTGLLVTLKALPSAYDKDLQEDKEPLFDAFDTLALALPVMAGVVSTIAVQPQRMAARLDSSLLATDLADYLVRRGVPFREAHRAVGAAVRLAEAQGASIAALAPADFRSIHDAFGDDVGQVFDIGVALARKSAQGGTAPASVRRQLEAAERTLGLAQSAHGAGL